MKEIKKKLKLEKLEIARLNSKKAEILAEQSRIAAEKAAEKKRKDQEEVDEKKRKEDEKKLKELMPEEPTQAAAFQTNSEPTIQREIAQANAQMKAQKKIAKANAKKDRRKAYRSLAHDDAHAPASAANNGQSEITPAASTASKIVQEDKTNIHGLKNLIPLKAKSTVVANASPLIPKQPKPLRITTSPSPTMPIATVEIPSPVPAVVEQAQPVALQPALLAQIAAIQMPFSIAWAPAPQQALPTPADDEADFAQLAKAIDRETNQL